MWHTPINIRLFSFSWRKKYFIKYFPHKTVILLFMHRMNILVSIFMLVSKRTSTKLLDMYTVQIVLSINTVIDHWMLHSFYSWSLYVNTYSHPGMNMLIYRTYSMNDSELGKGSLPQRAWEIINSIYIISSCQLFPVKSFPVREWYFHGSTIGVENDVFHFPEARLASYSSTPLFPSMRPMFAREDILLQWCY